MLITKFCRKVLVLKNARKLKISSQRLSNFVEDSVDLAYDSYGNYSNNTNQIPVIVLHGLLDSKTSWTNVSEAIHKTTGRKVINVDARNHGDSQHAAHHTYVHMAKDTARLIKKLGLPKVTLLGHSMGGRTAMLTSLLYPELISTLIAVDISPMSISQRMTNNFPRVLEVTTTIDFNGITNTEDAMRFAKQQLHKSGITQKYVVNFIVKNIETKSDKTVGWIPNMKILREYFPTLLKYPNIQGMMFPGQTLFIGAKQSDFLPSGDLPGIKTHFPHAQLKYISGVGHNIHEEDPESLIKLLTDFFIKYP